MLVDMLKVRKVIFASLFFLEIKIKKKLALYIIKEKR
jgi:hypothetical protein